MDRLKKPFPMGWYPADTELPYGTDDLNLIAFISEEVRRQRDSQWHVFRMFHAWRFAQGQYGHQEWTDKPTLTHGIIRELGRLIDEMNPQGYRDGDVWIGNEIKVAPAAVHGEMDNLLKEQHKITPIEAYKWFEDIHPFFDGNGRTGKVVYNWLNGTLDNPVWPIDLYGGIENP